MNIYKFMMVAKEESLKSDYHKAQIGAVVVKGNKVLSKAYNEIRHCKVGKRFSPWDNSVHAERNACRKVDKEKLKGTSIFVYRETKDGMPALALPCDDCFNMIQSLGIKRIYFSTNKYPFFGEIRL